MSADVDRTGPTGPAAVLRAASCVRGALRAAARAVVPVQCAGCGLWDTALCARCRALLEAPPRPVGRADAVGDLEVWALAEYAGPVRAMVLGWKSGRRQDLGPVMTQVGALAGQRWAASSGAPALASSDGVAGLLVVPAPSGPARRARGLLVAADLADAVARGAARGLADAERAGLEGSAGRGQRPLLVASADVLRRGPAAPWRAHQSGRSLRARRRNRATAPRVLAPVAGWAVLLVDDVVTTGSTLGACARALEGAGARVLGALALAAPPAPSGRTRMPGAPVAGQDAPTEDQMKCGAAGASSDLML